MPVERLDPSRIGGVSDEDVRSFVESDFKIRSGLCPNGCGLMALTENHCQECPTCGFFCNTRPEKDTEQ